MKILSLPILVIATLFTLASPTASAQSSFAYAGFLEVDGVPLNGPVALTFVLETEAGTELATVADVGVLASAGSFAVEVGPVDVDILAMEPLYLRIGIDGVLLLGRQAFVSVPRSAGAQRALDDFLVPGTVSADILDANTVNTNSVVTSAATVTGAMRFGASVRQMIHLYNEDYGIGVQSGTLYFRSGSAFAWFRSGSHNDEQFNAGGGINLMTLSNTSLDVNRRLDANAGINLSGTLNGGSLGADCGYTGYQSKGPLTTTLTCPAGQYMAGVGFQHASGQNGTHQESFRIYCCSL